jgi:UrcA family protein
MTMNIRNHRKLAILSALLCAVSAAHAAQTTVAATRGPVATTTVSYGDLNLASQSGVATLYRRLSRAADRVCGEHEARSPREHAEFRACRTASLNRAVQQVGHPGVLALHSGQRSATGRG